MSRNAVVEPVRQLEPVAVPGDGAREAGRRWWLLVLVAAVAGVASTMAQTVERIAWAKDPLADSICDVNSSLSCTAVFGHWQSAALGVPNSLIGGAVFALLASGALAGLTGSRLSRAYLGTLLGLTLFMTGFVTWYLAESALSLKVLCLYCVACGALIVAAGIGLTRATEAMGGLGTGRAGRALTTMVRSGSDVIAWLGLAAVVAALLVFGLALG